MESLPAISIHLWMLLSAADAPPGTRFVCRVIVVVPLPRGCRCTAVV